MRLGQLQLLKMFKSFDNVTFVDKSVQAKLSRRKRFGMLFENCSFYERIIFVFVMIFKSVIYKYIYYKAFKVNSDDKVVWK